MTYPAINTQVSNTAPLESHPEILMMLGTIWNRRDTVSSWDCVITALQKAASFVDLSVTKDLLALIDLANERQRMAGEL